MLKDVLMYGYVQLLPQSPAPPQTAVAMGFLLDVLVTLFLLLALRLCMIILYDLIKLKHARHDNCQQVLVYGTGDKSVSLVTRLQNSPHYQVSGFLTYGKLLKNHTIADRRFTTSKTNAASNTSVTVTISTAFFSPRTTTPSRNRNA